MGFFPLLFKFIMHSLQYLPVLTIYYILFVMMYIIIKALQEYKKKFAETCRIYMQLNVCI